MIPDLPRDNIKPRGRYNDTKRIFVHHAVVPFVDEAEAARLYWSGDQIDKRFVGISDISKVKQLIFAKLAHNLGMIIANKASKHIGLAAFDDIQQIAIKDSVALGAIFENKRHERHRLSILQSQQFGKFFCKLRAGEVSAIVGDIKSQLQVNDASADNLLETAFGGLRIVGDDPDKKVALVMDVADNCPAYETLVDANSVVTSLILGRLGKQIGLADRSRILNTPYVPHISLGMLSLDNNFAPKEFLAQANESIFVSPITIPFLPLSVGCNV
jgi:hypothetical protein